MRCSHFLQDMPFWIKQFPSLPLRKIAALQPFWENGVLARWLNLQLHFVDAMETQMRALTTAFPLQSILNPRAQLVNAYLMQLVGQFSAVSDFGCRTVIPLHQSRLLQCLLPLLAMLTVVYKN